MFPPAASAEQHGYSQKRAFFAPEAALLLHFESCSYISVICAKFQGLTERSSSGARGEFLPPLESAFFDTFFHASAERKYEKPEFGETPRLRAVRKLDKIRFSLDFRRNHLKRRSFLGLNSPHILGLISIFNGKPLKIEEKGYSLSDEGMKA